MAREPYGKGLIALLMMGVIAGAVLPGSVAAKKAKGPSVVLDAGVGVSGKVTGKKVCRANRKVWVYKEFTGAAMLSVKTNSQGIFKLPEVSAAAGMPRCSGVGKDRSAAGLRVRPRSALEPPTSG